MSRPNYQNPTWNTWDKFFWLWHCTVGEQKDLLVKISIFTKNVWSLLILSGKQQWWWSQSISGALTKNLLLPDWKIQSVSKQYPLKPEYAVLTVSTWTEPQLSPACLYYDHWKDVFRHLFPLLTVIHVSNLMPHALTTVVTCGAGDQNFDKLCLDTQLELGLLCLLHPIWLRPLW